MRSGSALLLASLSVATVWAADLPTCGPGITCPEEAPCCSQYGQCGTGAYCLGGCDPMNSFSVDSCAPEPICVDKKYTSFSMDDMKSHTEYLGNASAYDWVYSGYPMVQDNTLLMTMPNLTGSTLVANNHYIWYGKIKGKLKSSRDQGVITGFILLSDVKDEIDYEFVGNNLAEVQTNYYFQGIPNYDNGGVAMVDGSDTFGDWHEYELDWNPDRILWIVDGEVKRTLNKADTFNATSNQFMYPQTPARLQMSLWPGGGKNQAPGTIKWAGGPISWDSQDMKEKGYYYAQISEVSIECYQPPAGANIQGSASYVYTSKVGTNNTVEITDRGTVLASLEATGTNMTAHPVSSSTSSEATSGSKTVSGSQSTSSAASSSSTIPQVEGGSPNAPGKSGGDNGSSSGPASASVSASASASSFTSSSSSSSSPSSGSGSFSQDGSSGSKGKDGSSASAASTSRILSGSLYAIMVGTVALMVL